MRMIAVPPQNAVTALRRDTGRSPSEGGWSTSISLPEERTSVCRSLHTREGLPFREPPAEPGACYDLRSACSWGFGTHT